ncbi:MAG: InlB B-repeat-containing protein [Lachnospiraceae bacterium]|nr:InlB B-repeat-containing protein [Lachnospiraceae bacterium]
MLKNWKRFKKSLLTAFTLMAAVVIMAFSSTVYAATQVTVTFNANEGTCGTKSKTVTYQKAYGELPTPTRKGYNFVNWYTEKEKGSIVVSATPVSKSYNHQIYAHWTAKTYTVYFKPEGGTVDPNFKKVVYDQKYGDLPSPSRTGYTFAGWYDGDGNRIYSSTLVKKAASHDLHAKWNPKKITITLDPNDGSVSPKTITIGYDEYFDNLPKPTRSGYTFAGWSKTKEGDPQYVNSNTKNKSTSNYTLYARWKILVSFNSSGGPSVQSRYYLLGTSYNSLPTLSMKGYRFLGWYPHNSRIRLYDRDPVRNLNTLYARWEKVPGTFKIDDCEDWEGNKHSKSEHKATFADKANDSIVWGLRYNVRNASNSVKKYAALYALDAIGSYYCQAQREYNGSYDCSSLVGRSYRFAGGPSLFTSLPSTREMRPALEKVAVRVEGKNYQIGDIMFNKNNKHVSIYVGTYKGVGYRVASEGYGRGVGYFEVKEDSSFTVVYRLK